MLLLSRRQAASLLEDFFPGSFRKREAGGKGQLYACAVENIADLCIRRFCVCTPQWPDFHLPIENTTRDYNVQVLRCSALLAALREAVDSREDTVEIARSAIEFKIALDPRC